MKKSLGAAAVVCGILVGAARAEVPARPNVVFKKTQLDDKFRSEGVAVGDFNHDGAMDVAAGSVYYAAPDWTMHAIWEKATEYDPHGYSNSFMNWADDFNGDGWTDLLVVDFPGKETWWYENPQGSAGAWPRHLVTPVTNNESPTYLDVDGDGRKELIMGVAPNPDDVDGPDRQMAILSPAEDPTQPWIIRPISAKGAASTMRFSHGLGIGDVDGDGRQDAIVPEGWWESPTDAVQAEWPFHPAPFGPICAHMYSFDYDGDGDNDILSSSAHEIGIWWYERTAAGWQQHEIDTSFSQTHALCLADINGDALPDFVTGKRWWAHGPTGDPGSDQPAVMYWFELRREDGTAKWIPHVFDDNSGIGTQFEVADVNADGLLDVVTANKHGAFYFQQVRE